MSDLRTQVTMSADKLRAAWTTLSAQPASALPPNCHERWIKRASYHRSLDGTARIFTAREAAWESVRSVASALSTNPNSPNEVTYGSQRLDFGIARHLSLVSYVASAWSIYDRISNVCGRLAAVADIADNPQQNPKACEDLIGKKDTHGFSVQFHIRDAYAWPLRVTYKVRNWLVHEGWEENNIPLFCGDSIGDGLRLHADAVKHLEQCGGYTADGGKITSCCLSSAEECWPTKDLLEILLRYHAELDTLFAGLLKWSVDSFVGQIEAFTARDRA
jgi:hypothetical protein